MNYGIDLLKEEQEQDGTEWVFGGASPVCTLAVAHDARRSYLPRGEAQHGQEDFMDCVSRGYLNILETKFTHAYRNGLFPETARKWLADNKYLVWYEEKPYIEFSDRFIAMKSDTTKRGNSLKAPAHAIHAHGLIPKSLLPASRKMTWEDYHNRADITTEMERLGATFLKRFPLQYEQVYLSDMETVLEHDMVNLAAHAWPQEVDGEYPRTLGRINHAIMGFELPKTYIFDNYRDDDWIKKLAPDYIFYKYGYRVFLPEVKKTKWELVLAYLLRLWKKHTSNK